MARFLEKYKTEIVPALMERFSYRNVMEVPRLQKISVNMGVGRATENRKALDAAMKDLEIVTGQKPASTRAKGSHAGFKVREGMPIGCRVTLRGRRMYEFLDRLISIVIPRIRDFRGFPTKSFDGRGNYSLGLEEQIVFPEINIDRVEFPQGMDVTFRITNSTDEESRELMGLFGFPFRRD